MANYTILLIDYEPRSIERFREPLEGAGYKVEIATDGISGIDAFHRINPDMVLVEAMIPKKHGFEVCQELKRTAHGRRTPILITTSVYKGRKYRTQALHIYGCDEYIEKPIAAEQLLGVVARFLGPERSGVTPGRGTEPAASRSQGGTEDPVDHGSTSTDAQGPSLTDSRSSKPPRSTPIAMVDDGEAEIAARLDAILPGSRSATTMTAAGLASMTDMETLASDAAATDTEDDPLAQIRAELNAELDALPEPPDIDSAPAEINVPIGAISSDESAAPSVLESLPSTGAEAEEPGKIITYEIDRSRLASEPDVTAKAPKKNKARVEVVTNSPQRRVPIWIWGGVVLSASVGFYVFFSGSTDSAKPTTSIPAVVAPAPAPVESKAVVQEHPPLAPPSAPSTPSVVEPPQTPPKAELDRPRPPAAKLPPSPSPKKPNEHATTSNVARTATPPTQPSQPQPAAVPPAVVATVPQSSVPVSQPQPPPQQPTVVDENVPGVEAIPDSTESARGSVTPGALIPIDEADVLPVNVSHGAPAYSALSRALRLSGTVMMNVLVNERGTVDQVVLVSGVNGGDLNDSAMRAARSWTYRPASKHGVPVKVWKSERVVFKR